MVEAEVAEASLEAEVTEEAMETAGVMESFGVAVAIQRRCEDSNSTRVQTQIGS